MCKKDVIKIYRSKADLAIKRRRFKEAATWLAAINILMKCPTQQVC